MKYLGKRGSHVGVMISFSLFIIFLFSIFLMIKPILKEKDNKSSILDSLNQKILENISSNMTLTILKIEDTYNSGGKNCLLFGEGGWESGESIVVKDSFGRRIASTFNAPDLRINWTGTNRFLEICSSSENFEEVPLDSSDCATPLEDSNFFIKSIKTEAYVFESSITRLETIYNSSYGDLKKYLGLSNEEEFGFSFINSQGITAIDVGKEPSSISIYSKEIPVVYIDNQSNVASGVIILKVW